MDNDLRPNEEQIRSTPIRPNVQLCLVLTQRFTLLGHPGPNQLRPDARPNDMTLAHISDTEHQAQLSVPLADDGILRKQQRLGAVLRPSHLRKNNSHHEGLNHDSVDRLEAHDEDRLWTFLRRRADTITDRMLRFDRKQETRGKRQDVEHTRGPSDFS